MPKGKYGKARRSANNKFGRYCFASDGNIGLVDIIIIKNNVPKTIMFCIPIETKLPRYYVYDYSVRTNMELTHITSDNMEKYKEYLNLFNTRNRELILNMYMDEFTYSLYK